VNVHLFAPHGLQFSKLETEPLGLGRAPEEDNVVLEAKLVTEVRTTVVDGGAVTVVTCTGWAT
jgi:hypothetical protein